MQKDLTDTLKSLALKRESNAKSLQEAEDRAKKVSSNPHDAVLDNEGSAETLAMYNSMLKMNDNYDVPMAHMTDESKIAFQKKDLQKALELTSQGPALEQKRYAAETAYEKEREEIYRKAATSTLLSGSEKKRYEDAAAMTLEHKKNIDLEHTRRLYNSNREVMKMALAVGDAKAFSAALNACMADKESADNEDALLSEASEATARVVGDRVKAAALQRQAFQRRLSKAKPAEGEQLRKQWDTQINNFTWWPEGDVGDAGS